MCVIKIDCIRANVPSDFFADCVVQRYKGEKMFKMYVKVFKCVCGWVGRGGGEVGGAVPLK